MDVKLDVLVQSYLKRWYKAVNSFTPDYAFKIVLISIVYLLAAKLGLSLAGVTEQVTTIWPPSAIALTALFVGGYKLWPGVWLGAFIANLLTNEPGAVAFFIAIGNTLSAFTGAYLLKWFGFKRSLERIWDVVGLIVFSAFLSTIISATIGTLSLMLGGIVSLSYREYSSVWLTWWIGDMMGILIFAPFLLLISSPKSIKSIYDRRLESAVIAFAIFVSACLIFTQRGQLSFVNYLAPYMMFPLIIWAVLRFEQIGAATSTFIIALVAIQGVVLHQSPFNNPTRSLEQNLITLHLFLLTVAITGLIVGVIVRERNRSQHLLETHNQALLRAKARALDNLAKRRESQRQQDYLVNMASHELKTPLTAAKLFADVLRNDIEDRKSKDQVKHIDKLTEELNRLSKLSKDLIDASQSRAGRLQIHKKSFDVDSTIANIINDMKFLFGKSRRLNVSGEVKTKITADQERIRQVLINLIRNAAAHSPETSKITVRLSTDSSNLVVKVQDFGHGIADNDQDKIFKPFYRSSGKESKKYPGLGLGLYIAKEIVQLHGGRIWVESQPEKGSTFAFSLPLRYPPKAKKTTVAVL